MAEPRLNGTAYEAALLRIEALREALSDITTTHASQPGGQSAVHVCARNALHCDDERAQAMKAKAEQELSLRDVLASCDTWLNGWAQHAGRCGTIGGPCTCGLDAVRAETSAALAACLANAAATGGK